MKPYSLALIALTLVSSATSIRARAVEPELSGKAYEQHFLQKLHMTNQSEITVGKLAQEKGQTEAVRSFGARLVKDHESADKKVLEVAKKDGIDATSAPVPMNDKERDHMNHHEEAMNRLHAVSGNAFDSEFKTAMEKGHSDAIKMVEDAQKKLPTTSSKQLASNLLPTLKEHEKIADQLPDVRKS